MVAEIYRLNPEEMTVAKHVYGLINGWELSDRYNEVDFHFVEETKGYSHTLWTVRYDGGQLVLPKQCFIETLHAEGILDDETCDNCGCVIGFGSTCCNSAADDPEICRGCSQEIDRYGECGC